MTRFLLALSFILLHSALFNAAQAQGFMERLTKRVAGQGTVTVTQDQRLTDLINGNGQKKTISTSTAVVTPSVQDEEPTTLPMPTGKKTKVRGFRIQVYWGGSQRTDQTKAQQAANKVSALFPEFQTYTSFESPHWRCRVGDFTDRNQAWEAMQRLREAGLAKDAMIVRSEIFIYQ